MHRRRLPPSHISTTFSYSTVVPTVAILLAMGALVVAVVETQLIRAMAVHTIDMQEQERLDRLQQAYEQRICLGGKLHSSLALASWSGHPLSGDRLFVRNGLTSRVNDLEWVGTFGRLWPGVGPIVTWFHHDMIHEVRAEWPQQLFSSCVRHAERCVFPPGLAGAAAAPDLASTSELEVGHLQLNAFLQHSDMVAACSS